MKGKPPDVKSFFMSEDLLRGYPRPTKTLSRARLTRHSKNLNVAGFLDRAKISISTHFNGFYQGGYGAVINYS
jgi:hypothetical protein